MSVTPGIPRTSPALILCVHGLPVTHSCVRACVSCCILCAAAARPGALCPPPHPASRHQPRGAIIRAGGRPASTAARIRCLQARSCRNGRDNTKKPRLQRQRRDSSAQCTASASGHHGALHQHQWRRCHSFLHLLACPLLLPAPARLCSAAGVRPLPQSAASTGGGCISEVKAHKDECRGQCQHTASMFGVPIWMFCSATASCSLTAVVLWPHRWGVTFVLSRLQQPHCMAFTQQVGNCTLPPCGMCAPRFLAVWAPVAHVLALLSA